MEVNSCAGQKEKRAMGKTRRNPNVHRPMEMEPACSGWKLGRHGNVGRKVFLGPCGRMCQCRDDPKKMRRCANGISAMEVNLA